MHRPGRVLLYLLIAAHASDGAAMIAVAFHSDLRTHSSNLEFEQRRVAIMVVMGTSFAQTALATWWTVMGRSFTWPVRVAAPVCVCAIWARVMVESRDAPAALGWVLYVGLAVAMLWVLVPWRILSDARQGVVHDTTHRGSTRWQFELRQLLALTLAAACTFALLSWCIAAGGWASARDTVLVILGGTVIATVTFSTCHRQRGTRWNWHVNVVLVITAGVAIVSILMTWRGRSFTGWYEAVTFGVEAVTIAATMAVLHVAARQPAGAARHSEPVGEKTALRGPEFG